MDITIHKAEVLQCLSRRGIILTGEPRTNLDEGIALLQNVIRPRKLLQRFSLRWAKIGLMVDDPEFFLPGEKVKNQLAGCEEIAVLAATLGRDADRLISVSAETDPEKSRVLQSCAAVALDRLCASAERELGIKANAEGKFITTRFVPGCGDFPLKTAKDLLSAVDAPCKIGLGADEEGTLFPAQSVTAVIGISAGPILDKRKNCEMCCLLERCQQKKEGCHCGE